MARSLATVGAMTFGIILPNKGEGAGPELVDTACAEASAAGWRSAWVTDHLMVPRGPEADEYGVMLEALTTLAWAGGRYKDLVFGTSVISPAMRDAPMLAKELATIDVLLGGRLIVGVGVSDTDDFPEYSNMGKADRFKRRGVYVDEAIRLWRHLWSGSTEPFEGEFHQLTDFSFGPLPVQGAGIPIWAGGRSARALRRTAELADGYHAAQTGPSDLDERLPQLREALALTRRPWPFVSTRARVRFDKEPRAAYSMWGTDEMIADEVARFAAAGNDELILVFESHDPSSLTAEIARFRDSVVPLAAEKAREAASA
ncbi:LLM class flavin-dependent oxidoreductase [Lacisediminihabitans sp.]|uniref:LLM class flavin-dependent oxidoreductase n=1 Tax=Lacisediminihabitans sp. TaxID=2787631 RepID=UPI00374DDE32